MAYKLFLSTMLVLGITLISFIELDKIPPGIFEKFDSLAHISVKYKHSNPQKKYTLSICSIFKNEAPYLKEWIEYHQLSGVDHFYLYNIGSTDNYLPLLTPYVRSGVVTLIDWPEATTSRGENDANIWALSTQIPAYENAVNFRARFESKWLVIIDIDEYLVCPNDNSIVDLLEKYEDYPGISITTDCFDAAKNGPTTKKLLIQSVDLINSPPPIANTSVAKMIFQPQLCEGFTWPPYQCRFKDVKAELKVDRKEMRINRYLNRGVRRKAIDSRDRLYLDSRFLSKAETSQLLEEGYIIQDQDRPIYRYVDSLLQKMGYSENETKKILTDRI